MAGSLPGLRELAEYIYRTTPSGGVFNPILIEILAPPHSGVYTIRNDHFVLWVGRSDDIRRRLLEHARDPYIMSHNPTRYTFEWCPEWMCGTREVQVFDELRPLLNRERPLG